MPYLDIQGTPRSEYKTYARGITGYLIQGPAKAQHIAAALNLPAIDVLHCLHNVMLDQGLVALDVPRAVWSLPNDTRR